DYAGSVEKLEEYDAATADPSFWEDADRAQEVAREQAKLKKLVEELDLAAQALEDGKILYEMAREEGDEDSVRDAWQQLQQCDAMMAKLEFRRMLSGPHDAENAIISINAGAGGVDRSEERRAGRAEGGRDAPRA